MIAKVNTCTAGVVFVMDLMFRVIEIMTFCTIFDIEGFELFWMWMFPGIKGGQREMLPYTKSTNNSPTSYHWDQMFVNINQIGSLHIESLSTAMLWCPNDTSSLL